MKEINANILPSRMLDAAEALHEGDILIAYKDGSTIRMETAEGIDPYVWRSGRGWVATKPLGG